MTRLSAHSIVEIPVKERPGAALPIMFLGDGDIAIFVAAYARDLHFRGKNETTIGKTVRAVGLLYDFYVLAHCSPVLDAIAMGELLKHFYEARRWGQVDLHWSPVGSRTARNDLRYVSEFCSFCADNFGHLNGNPLEAEIFGKLKAADAYCWQWRFSKRGEATLLPHTFDYSNGANLYSRAFVPERGAAARNTGHKSFPPLSVGRFIEVAPSVRDKLIYLLLFFGGVRVSEVLHLYVCDVGYDEYSGCAKVRLCHPSEGKIVYERDGRRKTVTRRVFLNESYGLVPRNKLSEKNPDRSGWKGMTYDDASGLQSEVYWIDERVGRLFWRLHKSYLLERLRFPDKHPYYFISFSGNSMGEPLKLANLHNQFDRNVVRAGVDRGDGGVSPHGARHFYGFYSASILRLSKEKVKKMMRHRSLSSTDVYYDIDPAVVRSDIRRAHEEYLDRAADLDMVVIGVAEE